MDDRDTLHRNYEAACLARDAARQRFEDAQRVMWTSEALWRDAEMKVQQTFVALANGEVER